MRDVKLGEAVSTSAQSSVSKRQAQGEAKRLGAFLLVGGMSTVLNLGIVATLTAIIGWPYPPSAILAYEIGVLFSFVLMERLAFRELSHSSGAWTVRLLRFHATYIVGATLTVILGESMVTLLHFPATVAHAIAIAFTTGVNFILLRLWAYRSRGAKGLVDKHSRDGASQHGDHSIPLEMETTRVGTRHAEISEQTLPRFTPGPTLVGDAPETLAAIDTPVPAVFEEGAALPLPAEMPRTWIPTTSATLALQTPAKSVVRRGLFGLVVAGLQAMRIKQWTKNGLVILAAVFSRTIMNVPTIERVALAFVAFSLAASSIYIINDIADHEKDRQHPRKRFRPIASGALGIPQALALAALCVAGAAAICVYILMTPFVGVGFGGRDPFAHYGGGSLLFVVALGVYIAQNLAYSTWLKHLVLWDVFSIAFGFLLRALAGAFAADVYISPWFYLCAIFLSLFLALGKRRAELSQVTLTATVGATRTSLQQYNLQLLDQLMTVVVTCAVMAYSLYTFQGEAYNHSMMLTIPLVIFGVSRYMYLVYVKAEGERPDELLFQDKQIVGTVALCGLVAIALLYGSQVIQIISHLPL